MNNGNPTDTRDQTNNILHELPSNNETEHPLNHITPTNNKGMLAFLNKETNTYNYSPYNQNYIQQKQKNEHRMYQKQKKNAYNNDSIIVPNLSLKNTEFTLLFFGASYCRHSIYLSTILSQFLNVADGIIQCIYIPMDGDCSTINYSGLGFYALVPTSSNQETKNILCTICTISMIPIVIVINNKNGDIVTDNGRYVIETITKTLQRDDEDCKNAVFGIIDKWRKGYSGASYLSNLCSIS